MTDRQKIIEYFNERRQSMIGHISQIVDIDSPSSDVEGSLSVSELIEKWFRDISPEIKIRYADADNVGRHLIIDCFDGKGAMTAVLGHTDTVHPKQSREKNPTRIDGDRLYGCGTFDMKANIVLMTEAIRYIYNNNLDQGHIRILLSCDEEVGSKSGLGVIRTEFSDASRCLVFEPSLGGKVKTGRKGTGMYTLTAHGISSHAGLEPERGANAILELSRRIEEIQSFNAPEFGTTVNVCTVSGGTASNVIPDEAHCSIDVRFTSMAEAERIDNLMRTLSSTDERVSLTLEGEINRPPLERTEQVAGLYEKAREIAESLGYELGETQVGGASDGNFVAAMGIPVLDGLGLSGDGAHTLEEYILIDDIVPRTSLVTILLAEEV